MIPINDILKNRIREGLDDKLCDRHYEKVTWSISNRLFYDLTRKLGERLARRLNEGISKGS